ncbi:MAG: hypothetical protein ACP5O1_07165 [Phycisphaerae bacterium]
MPQYAVTFGHWIGFWRATAAAVMVAGALGLLGLAGCSDAPIQPGVARSVNQAAASQPVYPALAEVLGNLAQASHNKCQLSLLAGFKGLSPAAAKFNHYMAQSQNKLLSELQQWAREHHLRLRQHHRQGLFRTADKLESSADAHALLNSSGSTFEHLYLLLMYTDYSWQIQLDKAALEFKIPPVPITYLKNALRVNRHSRQILADLIFSSKGGQK